MPGKCFTSELYMPPALKLAFIIWIQLTVTCLLQPGCKVFPGKQTRFFRMPSWIPFQCLKLPNLYQTSLSTQSRSGFRQQQKFQEALSTWSLLFWDSASLDGASQETIQLNDKEANLWVPVQLIPLLLEQCLVGLESKTNAWPTAEGLGSWRHTTLGTRKH